MKETNPTVKFVHLKLFSVKKSSIVLGRYLRELLISYM